MRAEKYPIDFDILVKGDVIAAEKIEDIANVRRTDRAYQLHALNLKLRIEHECQSRGMPVTCKIEADAIRILTDEEAVEYNAKAFEQNVRSLYRVHRRTMFIDRANLTDETKGAHDHALNVQAMQCLALKAARRGSLLRAHERTDPPMIDGASE